MALVHSFLAKSMIAILVIHSVTAAAGATVTCPLSVLVGEETHPLSKAKVFRGPVADKDELLSVHGSFDLSGANVSSSGKPLSLTCIYSGTDETRTMALPSGLSACDITDAGSGTRVSCH